MAKKVRLVLRVVDNQLVATPVSKELTDVIKKAQFVEGKTQEVELRIPGALTKTLREFGKLNWNEAQLVRCGYPVTKILPLVLYLEKLGEQTGIEFSNFYFEV